MRTPTLAQHAFRRTALHAAAALVLAVWVSTLTGCGKGARTQDPYTAGDAPSAEEIPLAIATARLEMQATPSQPYWPFRLGELYVAADSMSKAEESLKQSLWVDPYYSPALALLSKLYFDWARHEDAIGYLEVARSAPGEFPNGFPDELSAGLAVHYDAIGEIEVAETLMDDVDDSGEEARIATALTYVKLRGDGINGARDLAERALERDPKSAVNLNNFGITRLQAGDPLAARRAFLEANEIDPMLPGPYYNMAIAERFYFFNDDSARQWFERYWTLSRDDPDGLAEILLAEASEGEKR